MDKEERDNLIGDVFGYGYEELAMKFITPFELALARATKSGNPKPLLDFLNDDSKFLEVFEQSLASKLGKKEVERVMAETRSILKQANGAEGEKEAFMKIMTLAEKAMKGKDFSYGEVLPEYIVGAYYHFKLAAFTYLFDFDCNRPDVKDGLIPRAKAWSTFGYGNSGDIGTHCYSAGRLGEVKDPRVVDILLNYADYGLQSVREAALKSLEKLFASWGSVWPLPEQAAYERNRVVAELKRVLAEETAKLDKLPQSRKAGMKDDPRVPIEQAIAKLESLNIGQPKLRQR